MMPFCCNGHEERLFNQAESSEIVFSPAGFVLNDFLERANFESLPWAVQMNGDTSSVRVHKKTGCALSSFEAEPVFMERGDNSASSERTEFAVVNCHEG